MTWIITHGATVITPTIVLGLDERHDGGNIVHNIPGRPEPDVTLRPGNLRTGTLSCGFAGAASETASAAARALFNTGGVFTAISDERTTLAFSFVRAGRVARDIDPETRNGWVVTVDYQEVTV